MWRNSLVCSFVPQTLSCLTNRTLGHLWTCWSSPVFTGVLLLLTCSYSSPACFSLFRKSSLHFTWVGFTPPFSPFCELRGSSQTSTKSVQWVHSVQTRSSDLLNVLLAALWWCHSNSEWNTCVMDRAEVRLCSCHTCSGVLKVRAYLLTAHQSAPPHCLSFVSLSCQLMLTQQCCVCSTHLFESTHLWTHFCPVVQQVHSEKTKQNREKNPQVKYFTCYMDSGTWRLRNPEFWIKARIDSPHLICVKTKYDTVWGKWLVFRLSADISSWCWHWVQHPV